MIAITLPWPSAKLNPNRSKGLHWGATSALRKQARDGAVLLTKSAMQGQVVAAGAIALKRARLAPRLRGCATTGRCISTCSLTAPKKCAPSIWR